ncbi:MAG: DUF1320 family protein [Magnetococcales bacterium]|nr:DUF1320 family protein [Magnetococcales bacterium]NGZ05678.1 DUF1320 family protein [Magnetococcales bacterium]
MSYATIEQLLHICGARELAQIAVPEELGLVSPELMRRTLLQEERDSFTDAERGAADAGQERIVQSLHDATVLIDSYLVLRPGLPVSPEQVARTPLPRICAVLARRLLHRERVPEAVVAGHVLAMEWLRDLSAGRVAFLSGGAVVGAGAPDCISKPRIFDDSTLRGFVR